MTEKNNVGMQIGVSVSALIILTVSAVWLGRLLTAGEMSSALGMALAVLVIFALVSYAVVSRPLVKLAAVAEELERLSSMDGLTGLLNREKTFDRIGSELERAVRTGKTICVAVVDIDGLRDINSKLGPGAGDSVLRSVGNLVAESCRQYDSAGRLTSAEFLMMLPDTELEDAARAAERLRHRIEDSEFACYGEGLKVTVSVGVTQAEVDNGETSDELIRRALEAMEQARSEGGNRVRATASLAAVEGSPDSA